MRFSIALLCISATLSSAALAQEKAQVYSVRNLEEWNRAAKAAVGGDAIVLREGFSAQNTPLVLPWKETNGRALRIEGASGQKTVLDGSTRFVIQRSDVKLTNLTFSGHNASEPVVRIKNPDIAHPIAQVRLTNLVFRNIGPETEIPATRMIVDIASEGRTAAKPFPVQNIRIDHSVFEDTRYSIIVLARNGVQKLRIDHNRFENQAPCTLNGCDAVQLGAAEYGTPDSQIRIPMHAYVDHNSFIRIKGESELISVKSWTAHVNYNYISEPRGSINFRAGGQSEARGNVILYPDAYPFRINGEKQTIRENIVLMRSNKALSALSSGSSLLATGAWNATTKRCSKLSGNQKLQYYDAAKGVRFDNNLAALAASSSTRTNGAKPATLPAADLFTPPNCGCVFATQTPISCEEKPDAPSGDAVAAALSPDQQKALLQAAQQGLCLTHTPGQATPYTLSRCPATTDDDAQEPIVWFTNAM